VLDAMFARQQFIINWNKRVDDSQKIDERAFIVLDDVSSFIAPSALLFFGYHFSRGVTKIAREATHDKVARFHPHPPLSRYFVADSAIRLSSFHCKIFFGSTPYFNFNPSTFRST
jgi:hypothetical protein